MFKIIVQRYASRNLLGVTVLGIVIVILIGASRSKTKQDEFVYVARRALINFEEIKIDHERPLRDKMAFYKRTLGIHQKNRTWQQEIQRFLTRVSPFFQKRTICADYWVVFYEVSEIVIETAKRLPNWCVVAVMDGDEDIGKVTENLFLITGVIQRELALLSPFYQASLLSPKDLYTARKNLGYLWAIYHEATIIWDFDHTNEMVVNQSVLPFPLNETIEAMTVANYDGILFNPYLFFMSNINSLWPRGYPFRSIQNQPKQNTVLRTSFSPWPTKDLGVLHSLIEGYYPFYTRFLLAKPDLPLRLKISDNESTSNGKLIVPPRTFAPYDQQTTLHFRSALWALFLPVTVQQQPADSIRSYVMQRLMWDVGLQTAYAGSFLQRKNTFPGAEHTVLIFRKSDAARQGEKLFYFEIDNLAQFLTQWTNNEKNFIERIEQLFVALYQRGSIKFYDLYLVQLWLQELYQMDYVFPSIVS